MLIPVLKEMRYTETMNRKIVAAIIAALVLVGGAAVYMINQRNKNLESAGTFENKRLPGNTQTEKAVDNALSGKKPMDGESLPDNKAKPNDIQGSGSNDMRGDVIIEDKSDL